MGLEIERRFLVKGEDWKDLIKRAYSFRQGYLSTNLEGWTVRIRIIDDQKGLITLKTKAEGIANHEFEYEIPIAEAESIWELVPYKLQKIRYELNLNGGSWIVDSFQGENRSLIIAEVELTSQEELIQVPPWCEVEITGKSQMSNAALAKEPISICPMPSRLNTGSKS